MSKNFENLFDSSVFQDSLKFLYTSPVNLTAFMEAQEKNIQACNEAHQKWVEAAQNTGQLHMQILTDLIENNSALLTAAALEGSPEDKFAQQTEICRKGYEKTMKNMKALADLSNVSNKAFSDVLQKRMNAALNEIQASIEVSQKRA